jgi:hypothetical protein
MGVSRVELRAKMPEFDQGDAMTTVEMAEAAGGV